MKSGDERTSRSHDTVVHVSSTSAVAFFAPAASMIACGPPKAPEVKISFVPESKRKTVGRSAAWGAASSASRRRVMSASTSAASSTCPVIAPTASMSADRASHGGIVPRAPSSCRQLSDSTYGAIPRPLSSSGVSRRSSV